MNVKEIYRSKLTTTLFLCETNMRVHFREQMSQSSKSRTLEFTKVVKFAKAQK